MTTLEAGVLIPIIARVFKRNHFDCYASFLSKLKSIRLSPEYDTFASFEEDAILVAQFFDIKFQYELEFISAVSSIVPRHQQFTFIQTILDPANFTRISNFITNYQQLQFVPTSDKENLMEYNFNTPIIFFTSAGANSTSSYYKPETIPGTNQFSQLGDNFRSAIFTFLLKSPIDIIDFNSIQPFFSQNDPEFYKSHQSVPVFSLLNIRTCQRRVSNQTPTQPNTQEGNEKETPENEITPQDSSTHSDSFTSSDESYDYYSEQNSDADIPIQSIFRPLPPVVLQPVSEEDRPFHPYCIDGIDIDDDEEFITGDLFKFFYEKYNQLLSENNLVEFKLYANDQLPKDYNKWWESIYSTIARQTMELVDFTHVLQFNYYYDSFAYCFQRNFQNGILQLQRAIELYIDALKCVRTIPRYQKYTKEPKYPFDVSSFIENRFSKIIH